MNLKLKFFFKKMVKFVKGQGGKGHHEPSKLESNSIQALSERAGGFVTWAAVLTGLSNFAKNHEG
jgi:hypothetical protein